MSMLRVCFTVGDLLEFWVQTGHEGKHVVLIYESLTS